MQAMESRISRIVSNVSLIFSFVARQIFEDEYHGTPKARRLIVALQTSSADLCLFWATASHNYSKCKLVENKSNCTFMVMKSSLQIKQPKVHGSCIWITLIWDKSNTSDFSKNGNNTFVFSLSALYIVSRSGTGYSFQHFRMMTDSSKYFC